MNAIYGKNLFACVKKTPYFFSNFVTTIDGKVQVTGKNDKSYWPIGSPRDFETLLWLRAHADVLVHGKNTAASFNTLQTLAKKEFINKRKSAGKKYDLLYLVLSSHPDDKLISALNNPPPGIKSCILPGNNLSELVAYFKKNNLQKILVEGGPTVLASFLKENLIDEMFITIAPKVFGNNQNTKTMVEGYLFPPDKIIQFKLVSSKNIKSELYLRYRKLK